MRTSAWVATATMPSVPVSARMPPRSTSLDSRSRAAASSTETSFGR